MPKLAPPEWKKNCPAGMKALDQWVAWTGDRKIPKDPRNGRNARVSDSATWSSWEDAARWYERHQQAPMQGAGFVFTRGSGLVFLDFDDCLDENRKLLKWAEEIVRPFLGVTYVEVSPGGRGLHVFLIGALPESAAAKSGVKAKVGDGAVEVYHDRRFSTVTGDVYEGSKTLGPAQAQLDELLHVTGLDAKLGDPGVDGEDREVTPEVVEQVKKALAVLDPDVDYGQWVKVGMAMKDGLGEAGRELWVDWSRRGAKYKKGEPEAKWRSFTGSGIGLGSLFHVAEEEAGFSTHSTAEEDFVAFKGDVLEPETYEEGSRAKWRDCGLHLYLAGSGKNAELRPSEGEVNVGLWLQNHARWKAQLRWNARTMKAESLDGEAVDLHELARRCQFFMGWRRSPSRTVIHDALVSVAKLRSYDPVAEWLRSLRWDGNERLDGLCFRLGLENTPETRRCFRRWMIGAVARVFKPGCEMQNMLVLWGPQGARKSAVFRRLAVREDWYSQSKIDMTNKDGQLALLGPWIVENGELAGMAKADVEQVKVFISESTSRFRRPYGHEVEPHPRRCVLGGTTNEVECLRDATGSRRFWLIAVLEDVELRVDTLDDDALAQLWAEAVQAYARGERWWDEGQEVRDLQQLNEAHYEGTALDGYVEAVLVELQLQAVTTVQEVLLRLAEKYRLPPGVRQRDVGASMRHAGWQRSILRVAGVQRRFWHRNKAKSDEFFMKAAEQAYMRISSTEFSEERDV